jgi:hypothetical protein
LPKIGDVHWIENMYKNSNPCLALFPRRIHIASRTCKNVWSVCSFVLRDFFSFLRVSMSLLLQRLYIFVCFHQSSCCITDLLWLPLPGFEAFLVSCFPNLLTGILLVICNLLTWTYYCPE